MQEEILKLKGKKDLLAIVETLHNQESHLDVTISEIATLKRGKVLPQDTLRRSSIGSHFSGTIQQLNNYIDKKHLRISPHNKRIMARLATKADKILRENIVLQTISPLDVIPYKNVPIRYSYSIFGKREKRWGYALHKDPFNEDGNSVTIASMPPFYTQSLHNHTVSEYCLILDSRTEGIFFPGGKREKIYTTKKSQMLHFSATTPHTLRNPSKKYTRNITFKQSAGLVDWRPLSRLNKVRIVRARLIKGDVVRIDSQETNKRFPIKDRYYDYTVEMIRLKKDAVYKNKHTYDQYIFVVSGELEISVKHHTKHAKRNDFVVIDKNNAYTIIPKTYCRLYTVFVGI